jgi:hypothetical protein
MTHMIAALPSTVSDRRSPYSRNNDLPKLIPLWPDELDDASLPARRRLVGLLARALRRERRSGLAGHWSYDLARHAALVKAYRAECRATTANARALTPQSR